MNYIFELFLYWFIPLYVLWIFYLAVMPLLRAYTTKTISLPAKILGIPIMVTMLTIDAIVNIVVMTVMMLELPREWLVTQRLTRWCCVEVGGDYTWRHKIARWICVQLLDTFDPSGRHCK